MIKASWSELCGALFIGYMLTLFINGALNANMDKAGKLLLTLFIAGVILGHMR